MNHEICMILHTKLKVWTLLKSYLDETLKKLTTYKPALTKQPDHDEFWSTTLADVKDNPLNARLLEVPYPIKEIQAFELTYQGFDETPIDAHYILPGNHKSDLPCIIIFHGYGGNKKSVSHYMKWLIQGYAVIAVDCRGQGKSPDYSTYGTDAMGTWVTKGILNKSEYYYRKVYVDAVRAIDFASSRPEIDHKRIAIMGGSMGGGITLAVAALDDRPKLAIADIPNMCDLGLAMEQKSEGSLTHIEDFLHRYPEHIDRVYKNLTYFDNLNHARNITCRIRLSAGLKDNICPPQPIFGVYNHIEAPKSIEVYPFTGHDMDIIDHIDKTLKYVNEYL